MSDYRFDLTEEAISKAKDEMLRALAYEIRAEQVCGCVEESDDIYEWHERCCGAQFAANLVENHLSFPTPEEKHDLTRVEKFNERRRENV